MVTPAELAVVGTLVGSVSGAAITGATGLYRTKIQQESEDRRRQAEVYLDKKVEILSELHEKFAECHSILMAYIPHETHEDAGSPSFDVEPTEAQVEKVNELTREIRTLIIKSQLYLTQEQKKTLILGLMALNHALVRAGVNQLNSFDARALMDKAEDSAKRIEEDTDLEQYYERIYDAIHVLQSELDDPIKGLES